MEQSEFAAALGADVVIPVGESGKGLSIPEMLALRHWFDERQKRLRESNDR